MDGGQSRGGGGALGGFGTLGAMMEIKEKQRELQQRRQREEVTRREMEDDDAIRTTLPKYDRPDEAIDDLYKQGRATAAAKLGTSIYNERKAQAAAYDAQLVSAGKRLTQAGQIAQGISDDATYRPARAALVELLQPLYGDGINDMLPTVYDPKQMKSIIASGTARAQQITAEHNAATEIQTALDKGVDRAEKFTKIGSNLLSQANSKEQWDGYVSQLYSMGAPKNVLAGFGDWDDADPAAARTRASKLGLTGKEESDITRAADRDKVLKDQGDERNRIARGRAATAALHAGDGDGGSVGGRGSAVTATKHAELRKSRNKAFDDLDELYRADTKGGVKFGEGEDEAKGEYVSRRIQIEDDDRDAHNMLPMKVVAERAVAAGDKKAYDTIAEKFKGTTKGLLTLDQVVPWKGATDTPARTPVPDKPAAPAAKPAAKAAETTNPRKQADDLMKEYFATKDPARKAQILKEAEAFRRRFSR
jgi:hypothetical protein